MRTINAVTVMQRIEAFEKKYSTSFFELNDKYFFDLPDDIADYRILSPKDIGEYPEEILSKYFDFFIEQGSSTKNKDAMDNKRLLDAYHHSIDKSLGFIRKHTKNVEYQVMNMFKDDMKILDGLLDNPRICFNPLVLYSDNIPKVVPMVFIPSISLVKRYDFVNKVYYPNTSVVKECFIDTERWYDYRNERLIINYADVQKIIRGAYDPLMWGLIANKEYRVLDSLREK